MPSNTWVPQVNGVGPVLVALWADGFHGFRRFRSLERAEGFSEGWCETGGQPGAVRCMAFVLAGDVLANLKAEPELWAVVKDMLQRAGIAADVEGAS